MENIFRTIRRAIQKDTQLIHIEQGLRSHEVVAYVNLRVKKPFSVMNLRDYFAEQIISLCVKTGAWSISSLRFRVTQIEITGRSYQLHLVLAEKWKIEDAHRLEELIKNLDADMQINETATEQNQESQRWCDYVVGVCIHDDHAVPKLFGDPDHFTYFYNVNFVPYMGEINDDEFELLPTSATLTASDDEVSANFEKHNAQLGEVPELSTIASIMSATSETDGDLDYDIDKLILSADDAFSEFDSFEEPQLRLAVSA